MNDQLFFDVSVSAQYSEGIVRLGVAELVGTNQDGKRTLGPTRVILTTLQGMLQLQAQVNQMVDGLVEKGILRKSENPSATNSQSSPI